MTEPGWQTNKLSAHPPVDQWDDWVEYESTAWPNKVEKHYRIVPSLCFNCEAGCGIVAYVDKQTHKVRKIEGNPLHPGSRGMLCAKGAATPNQLEDPDRILYPQKRVGKRGAGQWEQISWDQAMSEIGAKMRRLYDEQRQDEIMYHIGRPGEDGYVNRVLAAWGVDAHNSHTNVCSSSARLGHQMWCGSDRPSPDWENAKTILLLTSHLETGHYFNPHAQRILEARRRGAKMITIDPRLSNTAAKSDIWLAPYSGTEGAIFLCVARHLLETETYDRNFVARWVNWEVYLERRHPGTTKSFELFIQKLTAEYAEWTFERTAKECGLSADDLRRAAEAVADSDNAFATYSWRSAASGNLWGWQITRCLDLLIVLTGSYGTKGGVGLASWHKFKPKHHNMPGKHDQWNELLLPIEFPLAFFELSFLLPHFRSQRKVESK